LELLSLRIQVALR